MAQPQTDLGKLAGYFLTKKRIAVAKRFDAISLEVLLGLESELHEIERRGFQGPTAYTSPGSFTSSQPPMSPTSQAGDNEVQLATFDDVRKKLETYHDFLLRFINLYSLKPMDHIDKQTLRDLLTDFSNENPQFKIDSTTWTGSEDLIGVFTTHLPRRDRFTELLMDLMFCIRRRVGKFSRNKTKKHDFYANEEKIAKFMTFLNIFMASILNVSALFILYVINSTLARIGTICAFSLLFSLSSLAFTTADPIMVYTSTAAYSAVLVVFIGNVN